MIIYSPPVICIVPLVLLLVVSLESLIAAKLDASSVAEVSVIVMLTSESSLNIVPKSVVILPLDANSLNESESPETDKSSLILL